MYKCVLLDNKTGKIKIEMSADNWKEADRFIHSELSKRGIDKVKPNQGFYLKEKQCFFSDIKNFSLAVYIEKLAKHTVVLDSKNFIYFLQITHIKHNLKIVK